PKARVACETLVKTGLVVLAGEINTSAKDIPYEQIVREAICRIGYDSPDVGFDGRTCGVLNCLGAQSPDIAQGVDRSPPEDQGAGDQGLMFGYATNETDVLMPAPITYAHRLMQRQAEVRRSGALPWLGPDAKSQISLRYEHGKPVAIEDRKSTRLNSSHVKIAYAVFCLKKREGRRDARSCATGGPDRPAR